MRANKILSPHAPNPDDIVVLITAPTATAAFNIGGTTLHQAFSLSKSLPFPYIYKRDDEINKLRTKLQNLQILIIDEISMVSQRVLLYISERLRQIKQSGNALFGNICVIAVGDFYQLPPVKQKCLYDLRPEHFFPLWSLNFSLVELNQIMRQKEDSEFAQLLNRLRVKKKTEHLLPRDLSVLQSCMQHSVPLDSLHIFATNKEIDSHNSKMIDKVCEETVTIMAQDYDRNPKTGELILRPAPYDSTHDYLPAQLLIGPNARVMLTRNIDITIGLVNGVIGTVISILPGQKGSSLPHAIKVLFDNENIGRKPITSSHSTEHIPIDIPPIEESLRKNAVRYQFPLQLAWACTTHKVQGITTDKAVISMKNIFDAGMAYVALSRVKSKDGLLLQDLDEDKIYCTEQISTALQRMPKYLVEQHYDQKQNQLRILLHNIQGLIPHIEDLQANSDIQNVNFICLTETWMESNSVSPNLTNFNLIHKPRSSSYSSAKGIFEDLSNKKHGGVGIYVRISSSILN
ncbi:ATP-dependent DNA helicase PIF1-like [Mytilus edulis]|uniref:ATP-dependent DNA helicase PIF1-like n=1 Tax=Mytilus edulis TaxID=6550 RepID=UPI0039EF6660